MKIKVGHGNAFAPSGRSWTHLPKPRVLPWARRRLPLQGVLDIVLDCAQLGRAGQTA